MSNAFFVFTSLLLPAVAVYLLTENNASQSSEGFTLRGGSSNGPELVLFKAEWCGYCKKFKPMFDKLVSENNIDGLQFTVVDADSQKPLVAKHGIESFPTLKLCKNGVNSTQNCIPFEAERTLENLKAFLRNNL